MVAGRLVVEEALLSARYADAADVHAPTCPVPLPLSGDDVYMFGLPWDPWLAYGGSPATPGDTGFVLSTLAAARRAAARLWAVARRAVGRR